MAAIYLAGKIGPLDWREDIVPGLHDAWGDSAYGSRQWGADDEEWPVLPNGALGQYDYTGPYFVDTCTHSDTGCGQSDHRAGSECEGASGKRFVTLQRCLRAIDRADIVFAWLSDLTAFGTLTEIGYAKGRGKAVIVASSDRPGTVDAIYDDAVQGADRHSLNVNHLWFAFTLADKVITTATPLEALKQFAGLNVQLERPSKKRSGASI